MADYLVVVESPAKAKTIKKYLGKNYTVLASNGHIRDLPKSQLGIDVENNFEPRYITIRGKGDLLTKLKKEAKRLKKYFSQLTLTVKVKLFPGILRHLWKLTKRIPTVLPLTKLQRQLFKMPLKIRVL